MYVASGIQLYVESYYKVGTTKASLMLPTIAFLNAFLQLFTVRFIQRNVEPKLLVAIGAVCNLGCLVGALYSDNYWMFFSLFTMGSGLNTAWAYLVTTHHSWLWFPQNPGLASGICLSGCGVGALVFNAIINAVMNPDNLDYTNPCPGVVDANYGCYPPSVDDNFRKMILVLIGCYSGFALIGIVFIWKGPIVAGSEWNRLRNVDSELRSSNSI